MARYNREFLVPYLQNVCALHLARHKVSTKISDLDTQIRRLERGEDAYQPSKPDKWKTVTPGRVLSIITGTFIVFVAAVSFLMQLWDQITQKRNYELWLYLTMILIAAIGTWMIWGAIDLIKEDQQRNTREIYRYQQRVVDYNAKVQNNIQRRQQIPALQSYTNKLSKELQRLDNLLDHAYNVNIIPSQYRGIYPAIYLYEWFRTSRADDLDMALNMYVLEEIKDKLDTIIRNQSEIILNQRMMLANQQKSLEQQQRHSQMMRAKLDHIATTNEERNIYLSMIERNTAATAYFAAADYIRRI